MKKMNPRTSLAKRMAHARDLAGGAFIAGECSRDAPRLPPSCRFLEHAPAPRATPDPASSQSLHQAKPGKKSVLIRLFGMPMFLKLFSKPTTNGRGPER